MGCAVTRWHAVAIGAVVIVAVVALLVWWAQPAAPTIPEEAPPLAPEPPLENLAPTPAPPPAAEIAPPEACVLPPPPMPLPALAESDAAVAGEVTGCVGGLAPLWLAEGTSCAAPRRSWRRPRRAGSRGGNWRSWR